MLEGRGESERERGEEGVPQCWREREEGERERYHSAGGERGEGRGESERERGEEGVPQCWREREEGERERYDSAGGEGGGRWLLPQCWRGGREKVSSHYCAGGERKGELSGGERNHWLCQYCRQRIELPS